MPRHVSAIKVSATFDRRLANGRSRSVSADALAFTCARTHAVTPRLSTETLCEARAHVRRPAYDRSRLSTGIVHLGLGAFARAHLCAYTEDCIERGGAEHWGIAGVNLRSTEQRDRLLPQDRLYTLVPRGEKGLAPRVIGCLTEVLAGPVR